MGRERHHVVGMSGFKTDALASQPVDPRRFRLAPVGAKRIRAQRVDGDEQNRKARVAPDRTGLDPRAYGEHRREQHRSDENACGGLSPRQKRWRLSRLRGRLLPLLYPVPFPGHARGDSTVGEAMDTSYRGDDGARSRLRMTKPSTV